MNRKRDMRLQQGQFIISFAICQEISKKFLGGRETVATASQKRHSENGKSPVCARKNAHSAPITSYELFCGDDRRVGRLNGNAPLDKCQEGRYNAFDTAGLFSSHASQEAHGKLTVRSD